MTRVLDVSGLEGGYGSVQILYGIDMHVDEGEFVTIIGPNGCGKSNVVESLRWCMGETSPKSMRGSGMEDVIFSGTSDRPARNNAEVTIYLENTDRSAPSEYNDGDEIQIRRKIEIERGSEYKINGPSDLNVNDVFQKKMLVREKTIFFGDETESFVLGELPDWGEIEMPREIYLENSIPILLRESQKINEGKLPEALLNCWWLEMIICIDEEELIPTSISRLLWNPDERKYLKEKRKGQLINSIL